MSLIALAAALCSTFFCLLRSLIELAWLGSSFVPVNFCFGWCCVVCVEPESCNWFRHSQI